MCELIATMTKWMISLLTAQTHCKKLHLLVWHHLMYMKIPKLFAINPPLTFAGHELQVQRLQQRHASCRLKVH